MWHPNSTFAKTNSVTNKQAISTWKQKKTRRKLRSKWGRERSLLFLKQRKLKFLMSSLPLWHDNKYKYHDLIKTLNLDIKMTKKEKGYYKYKKVQSESHWSMKPVCWKMFFCRDTFVKFYLQFSGHWQKLTPTRTRQWGSLSWSAPMPSQCRRTRSRATRLSLTSGY